jgi:acetylglutamate kinase
MKKLYVIKVGGNILDDPSALDPFLKEFAAIGDYKILVHGGGKLATEMSSRLGIQSKMIEGRRVTDAETLKITTMVYAGWINKTVVATLGSFKCSALGICGSDAQSLLAMKRPVTDVDFGFVGDIASKGVNAQLFSLLLHQGITPVVAPITCDIRGQLLNTNADTLAATIASAMSESYNTQLIYCFEKKGVLKDRHNNASVMKYIDPASYEMLKEGKIIADGMIPKLDNAFLAKKEGVNSVVIGHASDLLNLTKENQNAGTFIHN